ncbi:ferrochelatase [Leptospira perolatii]|uniref:Ferrochelatase n=1 Tax=Leptospira perolatii TaxID=2023191 RepID=A0A2M9ZPS5_9LEPT|nr:ferrochelatase [Leptospira perolatii]PJZ74066.1 ferrochelatase [Leptospira perolatii]
MQKVSKNRLLLLNLGGPRAASEIPKFLMDLFEDPLVFDLPIPEALRLYLARKIAESRSKKVQEVYASMGFGGGSPLVSETERQAKELQKLLEKSGEKWEIKIAMACGYPHIREIDPEWLDPRNGVIILPLFPHFSRSTVLSTAMILKSKLGFCPISYEGWIQPFFDKSEYLESVRDLILDFFNGHLENSKFLHLHNKKVKDWQNIDIVFSAHGIPMRLVHKGDDYVREIERNTNELVSLLREAGYRGNTHLAFQSRVGPSKWTTPNTLNLLEELSKAKVSRVAIYPISFVSDHLETLEEIGVQMRDKAKSLGFQDYYRIPTPGTYPPFIRALATIIERAKAASNKGTNVRTVCTCKSLGGFDPSKEKVLCSSH